MKAKINITAAIGLFLALFITVFIAIRYNDRILINQQMSFWIPVSIAISIGGTILAILYVFPITILKRTPKMIGMIFRNRDFSPYTYIEKMVHYGRIANLRGILALEKSANECKDPFIKSALMLIIDINDKEKVLEMLDDVIDFTYERHEANISIWLKCSAFVSGIGMIGTIAGFINIFVTLSKAQLNTSMSLGTGMMIALCTTFYSCLAALAFFSLIAYKLKKLNDRELICMKIVKEGAAAIVSRTSPQDIQEKLEFEFLDI